MTLPEGLREARRLVKEKGFGGVVAIISAFPDPHSQSSAFELVGILALQQTPLPFTVGGILDRAIEEAERRELK